jgi:hypothetical protein
MTCKACKQTTTVPCYNAAPHVASRSYDLIGQVYAIGRTLCGRIDKTGRARHLPHHHYTTFVFNALDTVQDLDYPGPPVGP